MRLECLWCREFRLDGLRPEACKPLDDLGVLERRLKRSDKLVGYVLWQSLRGPHGVPGRDLKALDGSRIERRQVGQRRDPGFSGDGETLDLALFDLVGGVGRLVAHYV